MKIDLLSILFVFLFISCSGNENNAAKPEGQTLYEKNCSLCHGKDGKQMSAGAPDLTKSQLDASGLMKAISEGSAQKGMPAYGSRLKKDELELIVAYVLKMRETN